MERVDDRRGVAEMISTSASPFHVEAGEFGLFEILIVWVEEVAQDVFENVVQGHVQPREIAWAYERAFDPSKGIRRYRLSNAGYGKALRILRNLAEHTDAAR
jgi:hypothetical protein